MKFESFANSKRYKTCPRRWKLERGFESFANSKRYKTNEKRLNNAEKV